MTRRENGNAPAATTNNNESSDAAATASSGATLTTPLLPTATAYQQPDGSPVIVSSPPSYTQPAAARQRRARRPYKGFTTPLPSISSNPRHARVDCCSLACFGLFQSDYNHYVLTGIKPPSFVRRTILHILIPLSLFIGMILAANMIQDELLAGRVVLLLLIGLVVFVVMDCWWCRVERVKVRRELLRQLREEEEEGAEGSAVVEEEQTEYDMNCAHAFIGCYNNDIPYNTSQRDEDREEEEKEDLCGCLCKSYTSVCCNTCCECTLVFCGLCATAQEGREIELGKERSRTSGVGDGRSLVGRRRRLVDYVTFEPFIEYYPSIVNLRTNTIQSLYKHYGALSQLSTSLLQTLIIVLLLFLILSLIPMKGGGGFSIWSFVVLVGTFFQAFLLLYLVHWLYNRFDLSLDAVIKYFACGFVLTTGLALFFESLLGIVLQLLLTFVVALSGVEEEDAEKDVDVVVDGVGTGSGDGGFEIRGGFADLFRVLVSSSASDDENKDDSSDLYKAFAKKYPWVMVIYLFITAYVSAALVEELCKYFGYKMVHHPDFCSPEELLEEEVTSRSREEESPSAEEEGEDAGEEEEGGVASSSYGYMEIGSEAQQQPNGITTTATNGDINLSSNNIARQQQRQQQRTNVSIGAAITVAMVSVSLGFACCENLIYIFLYSGNTINEQVSVLLTRSLFPVHPICAAIQSIGVCCRDVENDVKHYKLGRIIMPALLLHGTYDFVLMLASFLVSLNDDSKTSSDNNDDKEEDEDELSTVVGLVSLIASVTFVIAGLVYYFCAAKAQRKRLEGMDDELRRGGAPSSSSIIGMSGRGNGNTGGEVGEEMGLLT